MAKKAERAAKAASFDVTEYGRTGLRRWGGQVREEFLQELQGDRGRKVIREMVSNDPIVGAILYATEQFARQVSWRIEPPPGADAEEEKITEFVRGALFDDMSTTWQDMLSERLTMLPWGFESAEIVYKQRSGEGRTPGQSSRFSDGMIGWRKGPTRALESLFVWRFDDEGGVQAFVQRDPNSAATYEIPIEKSLLFRTSIRKGNPEGVALPLDTPIPTPDGWATMGSLQVGDKVFGGDGRIRYVVAKSQVWMNRPIYEITTSAGSKIRADANHLWCVMTGNDRNFKKPARVVNTETMSALVRQSLSIGKAPVLDGSTGFLPVDPYILGYWLGDGSSGSGNIAVQPRDFPSLHEQASLAGYETRFDGDRCAYVYGLTTALRAAGVLCKKHVPRAYLRAKWEDRLALLLGLMDSDGNSPRWGNDHAPRVEEYDPPWRCWWGLSRAYGPWQPNGR